MPSYFGAGGGGKTAATIVVAASDSKDTSRADYVCDGTDDQEEINNAINALPSAGGQVILLEGTYNISGTISILKNNVTLAGQGFGTKLFLTNGADCHVIQVGDGSTALSGIVIRDLQIDGNKSNQSALSYGIYFYGGSTTKITKSAVINCYIYKCRNELFYSEYADYNLVINNKLYSGGGAGIYLKNSNNNTIIENQIDTGGSGIYLFISGNNTIAGNQVNSNSADGMSISGNNNVIIGNQANSNNSDGIYINGNNNVIIGNQANSNNDDGIRLSSADRNIIIGNYCEGNGGYGVNISNSNCDNNYVRINILRNNSSGGLNDAGTNTHKAADTTNDNLTL